MQSLLSLTFQRLARTHETPLWIYDAEIIRGQIHKLRMFDTIRFAQKSCPNISILALLRKLGVQVDAVSLGEIERAARAGFTPEQSVDGTAGIVFTADLFDRKTLQRIIKDGIEVNVGSIDMLRQLGEISPGHRVWLRMNPGFGHGHSNKTNTGGENSKHGIWFTELPEALALICRFGLNLVGLHVHIGSGVDYAHLQRVCDAMRELLARVDVDFEAISAGGGLSVPYQDGDPSIDTEHYFTLWHAVRQEAAQRLGHPVRLEIEPGRYLVAESGVLIAEIRAMKNMGSNYFMLVDAGFNDLMRPAMYGSFHRLSVVSRTNGQYLTENSRPTFVAGPLCESGDVFTQSANGIVEHRMLPSAQIGDFLVFHTAGAYGASMS